MPDFFSWLVDKKVCGMGFPWDKENIRYLLDNNVYYLISLTEEAQPKVDTFPGNYIINISRGFCESGIYLFIWYMLRRSTLCFKLPHAIVYPLFCLHIFFQFRFVFRACVVVVQWWLKLQLPVQSVSITTNVVTSNPVNHAMCTRYNVM